MRVFPTAISALLFTTQFAGADERLLIQIDPQKVPELSSITSGNDVAVAIAKVTPQVVDQLNAHSKLDELEDGNGVERLLAPATLDASSAASVNDQASGAIADAVAGLKVNDVEAVLILRRQSGENEWPCCEGGGIKRFPKGPVGPGPAPVPSQTAKDLLGLEGNGMLGNGSIELFEINK
ncbi:hypothetical protein NKI86_24165 [Mesorhizobium sp. M0320]|uniref:hypothetical protein n=1 Tax=unclassified Mesorhizobium TaxID=325217 RepID=UPI003337EBD2